MITRRQLLKLGAGLLALPYPNLLRAADLPLIQRKIPSSGEMLPVIGMGTSRTFNTDNDAESLAQLTAVIQEFFKGSGKVIDSSPMYGSQNRALAIYSETCKTILPSFCRDQSLDIRPRTGNRTNAGISTTHECEKLRPDRVHNLVDWKTQLATLKNGKKKVKSVISALLLHTGVTMMSFLR